MKKFFFFLQGVTMPIIERHLQSRYSCCIEECQVYFFRIQIFLANKFKAKLCLRVCKRHVYGQYLLCNFIRENEDKSVTAGAFTTGLAPLPRKIQGSNFITRQTFQSPVHNVQNYEIDFVKTFQAQKHLRYYPMMGRRQIYSTEMHLLKMMKRPSRTWVFSSM